ncbi:MAG TPA: metal-sensitive transcriptional regulator [Kiritimatiellia bacterium]|nr:metal-sensitive transcriptional regulator [Kiritimatiellia bacterium]HRZ13162.1 metal-sensitive transcriptional regulator [Kiritimatiellia bacterium]HSA17583.1 metal-sensitive transcriptional regulator [Kiritimatiellia bacterium]
MKNHKTRHDENRGRLARIEGQVRGIRRMIEEGEYCMDIVTQVQASVAALQAVGRRVLKKHMEHCVADAFRSRSKRDIETKIAEILKVVRQCGG